MKKIDTSTIKQLDLPAMGQLGIVVKDIHQAIGYYSPMLNIRPWYRAKIVQSEIHYGGKPIDLELDIAVGYSGSLQFELIQVIRGDTNIYTDLLNTRSQGIHHIGFVVSRISERIAAFQQSGLHPI